MDNDNFFSIDRLIEFGLGMAVAQQMVQSMNHALSNTFIPGSMNPIGAARPLTYFAILEEKQAGPFSEQELARLITEGKISRTTYLWMPGMAAWDRAEHIAEVLKIVALCPPPFQPEGTQK